MKMIPSPGYCRNRMRAMRSMELSLEVRDEEMSVLTNDQQTQMDERFKFATDLQSHLEEITKEKGQTYP